MKTMSKATNARFPDPKDPIWRTPIVPIGQPHGKDGWFDNPPDLTPQEEAAITVTPIALPPVDYNS
jgi:hypothetical protein